MFGCLLAESVPVQYEFPELLYHALIEDHHITGDTDCKHTEVQKLHRHRSILRRRPQPGRFEVLD